jgi:hypothetical protein
MGQTAEKLGIKAGIDVQRRNNDILIWDIQRIYQFLGLAGGPSVVRSVSGQFPGQILGVTSD